jgi:segregation and condensation protein A
MDDRIDNMMVASEYSWRDILTTVLEGMDPWNIDIVELASRYSQKVDEMIDMNFRLPANVVLVSSVLLRIKADLLAPLEEKDPYALKDHMLFVFDSNYPIEAIITAGEDEDPYVLEPRPVRMLKRRVTAEELIEALQDVLRENEVRTSQRKNNGGGREEASDIFVENEISIVLLLEETYLKVMEKLLVKEEVLLSEIAKSTEELLSTFISLLHLVNDRKLCLRQEQLYGEVYINKI